MKKILIIGATSAIAEATARLWAEKGCLLFLVARNKERLEAMANDLRVRGSPHVAIYAMDANDLAAHLPMLDHAEKELEGLDTALIAHGTLANQAACQQSVALTLQEINTNALSVIALLTHIANRFEKQKAGTIAVISSVAGDRGRQSNYVYGSAKAMVSAFTSGLRQRLYKSGVSVVTIKPGPVHTPMTSELNGGLLWASPEEVAGQIFSGLEKNKAIIYTPGFWLPIMLAIKIIPENIFKKMSL